MTKLEDVVEATAIRPFRVNTPEAELTELRRRINATRWPEGNGHDASQGVQLAFMQALARYWATDYDWRKVEAKLKRYPNSSPRSTGSTFISFTFVRSMERAAAHRHARLARLAVEQLKIIDPLTNPTAHGGSASDAFHLVIPSMPGYGFSGKPTSPGWDPARMARAWVELMKRLGYTPIRGARR